jgi:hypothetical protein
MCEWVCVLFYLGERGRETETKAKTETEAETDRGMEKAIWCIFSHTKKPKTLSLMAFNQI